MRAVRPATLCTMALALTMTLLLPAGPAHADSTRDGQWWLKSLDVVAVQQTTQGEGITVAVVDTGVDAGHPDLEGNVLPGFDLYDATTRGRKDPHGHGTAIASLIAGHGHGAGNKSGILGIAPKAKILPVRVLRESGVTPPEALAKGVEWALAHGADVINVSAGTSFDSGLNDAVARAYARNVPVVASVGNKSNTFISSFPGAHPGAIGATTLTQKDGTTAENINDDKIDIAAPGSDMIGAAPGGGYLDHSVGSSGAAAIVSGAVALIRAEHPGLNSHDLFERVLWTTRDIGDKGFDNVFGWGALDLKRAVTGEPDDRSIQASAAPSSVAAAPTWEECAGCTSTSTRVLQAVAFFGGILVVIGLVVFFLVRRKRNKRRAAQPSTPAAAFAGAGPHHQAPGSYAQSPPTPSQPDDVSWRRPTS